MAPANALQAKPTAPEHSIFFDGLVHVNGTGRFKPARRRQHGGNEKLVKPNEFQSKPLHRALPRDQPGLSEQMGHFGQRFRHPFSAQALPDDDDHVITGN